MSYQRKGKYPPPKGASNIIGLEAIGHVVDPLTLKPRESSKPRLMALLPGGGYGQYVAVHKDHLIPVPKNLSLE